MQSGDGRGGSDAPPERRTGSGERLGRARTRGAVATGGWRWRLHGFGCRRGETAASGGDTGGEDSVA